MNNHAMMLRIHTLREHLARLAVAAQQRILQTAQATLLRCQAVVTEAAQQLHEQQQVRSAGRLTNSDRLLLTDSHMRSLIEAIHVAEGARVEASDCVDHEAVVYQKLVHDYLRLQEKTKLSAQRADAHDFAIALSREAGEEEALLEIFNSRKFGEGNFQTS
jgi:hypothetical protein